MNHQFNHMEDPIVPLDEKLRADDSFKVPTFYFESLTDRIMKRVEKEAVPAELKENVFKLPDGYFESFANRLMTKIQTKPATVIIRTGFQKSWMYSAAAVVVILVSLFVFNLFKNQNAVDYLANSSEDDLLEYVSTYEYEFDQNSLAMVMNEEDVNSLDVIDELDDETTNVLIELYK